jgi:hypothetical protein
MLTNEPQVPFPRLCHFVPIVIPACILLWVTQAVMEVRSIARDIVPYGQRKEHLCIQSW